jgi:hypothetical protein
MDNIRFSYHIFLLLCLLLFKTASGSDVDKTQGTQESIKKLEKRLNAEITVGPVDINLKRLIGYNNYEGFKTGIGAETNNKLSNYFSVGGYITYGFRDDKIRHGEWINIFPTGENNLRLHFGYRDQNLEIGGHKLLGEEGVNSDDFIRSLLINKMYTTHRYSIGAELSPTKAIRAYLLFDKSENEVRVSPLDENTPSENILYNLSRTGVRLRYEPSVNSLLFFNLYQGIPLDKSDYDFTKIELTGKFNLIKSQKNKGTIKIRSGKIWGTVPFPELFNGNGSFTNSFTLLAPYSFATMRINEFMADRFTAIHIRYIIWKLSFSETSLFKPDIVAAHNMGVGILGNDFNAAPYAEINDYSRGFYETGLELNNLLPYGYVNYGIGIYYRYGPYSFDKQGNNFALKLGMFFKF